MAVLAARRLVMTRRRLVAAKMLGRAPIMADIPAVIPAVIALIVAVIPAIMTNVAAMVTAVETLVPPVIRAVRPVIGALVAPVLRHGLAPALLAHVLASLAPALAASFGAPSTATLLTGFPATAATVQLRTLFTAALPPPFATLAALAAFLGEAGAFSAGERRGVRDRCKAQAGTCEQARDQNGCGKRSVHHRAWPFCRMRRTAPAGVHRPTPANLTPR